MCSAFGTFTPTSNFDNASSSDSFPSSTSCNSTVTTNVFVLLPTRNLSSSFIASRGDKLPSPTARTQGADPGIHTPTTAPGTLSLPPNAFNSLSTSASSFFSTSAETDFASLFASDLESPPRANKATQTTQTSAKLNNIRHRRLIVPSIDSNTRQPCNPPEFPRCLY